MSEELIEAFRAAQDGSKRFLVVRIEAEVLKLAGSHDATESEEDDFKAIIENVPEHEPSFVLFHRDVAEDSEARAWNLISYVNDPKQRDDLVLCLGCRLRFTSCC